MVCIFYELNKLHFYYHISCTLIYKKKKMQRGANRHWKDLGNVVLYVLDSFVPFLGAQKGSDYIISVTNLTRA